MLFWNPYDTFGKASLTKLDNIKGKTVLRAKCVLEQIIHYHYHGGSIFQFSQYRAPQRSLVCPSNGHKRFIQKGNCKKDYPKCYKTKLEKGMQEAQPHEYHELWTVVR